MKKIRGERGWAVTWGFRLSTIGKVTLVEKVSVERENLIAYLKAAAADELPPSTRFEIRERKPDPFSRTYGMAWYRHPYMDHGKTWRTPIKGAFVYNADGLVGRFVTPAKKRRGK